MKKNVAIPLAVLRAGDKRALARFGIRKMTLAEIEQYNTDQVEHDEYVQKQQHRDLRAREYPPVGDQLDALWKAFAAMAAGKKPPAEAIEILAKIKAIKEKYQPGGGDVR